LHKTPSDRDLTRTHVVYWCATAKTLDARKDSDSWTVCHTSVD